MRENKKIRIFFDLEDTVIDSFMNDERFINVREIKNFIKKRNITEIEIFSRAIWTNKERKHFQMLRRHFPDILGVEVVGDIPTTEELIKMISKNKHLSLMARADFFDFFDKQDSFFQMVLFFITFKNCRDTHFVLVDDAVSTLNMEFPHKNVSVEIINVKDIIEEYLMRENNE